MRSFVFYLSLICATSLFAQEQVVDIDMSQTVPQELAAFAVLGEICPTLIHTDKAFDNGYKKFIKEALLPHAKNPVAEFKILTESDHYKEIMATEREYANHAGKAANKEICIDIQQYGLK